MIPPFDIAEMSDAFEHRTRDRTSTGLEACVDELLHPNARIIVVTEPQLSNKNSTDCADDLVRTEMVCRHIVGAGLLCSPIGPKVVAAKRVADVMFFAFATFIHVHHLNPLLKHPI